MSILFEDRPAVAVVRPWGAPERAMESFLRSFLTKTDLLARWPYADVPAAEVVEAWELLQFADIDNRTDAVPAGLAADR